MIKAFLSYSSKQSGFIDMVANSLLRSHILYDCYTFESGDSIIDEIEREIGVSHVFVLFISKESLESSWVKKEVIEAKESLLSYKLSFFLPLVIDSDITHEDERIPGWIRDSYSLHYISKPTYCAERIKQAIIMAEWAISENKRKDSLFVGRNKQMDEFEEKQGSYFEAHPVCCFIKGMPTVGRKFFLRKALVKSSIIRESYNPRIYKMDNRMSIEDLITYLYQAGYSSFDSLRFEDLVSKPIEEKIALLIMLIKELHSYNEVLIIDEYFSLINRDNKMVDWLLPVIEGLRDIQQIVLCIVTSHSIHDQRFIKNQHLMFAIQIPMMDTTERNLLFDKLIKQEKVYPSIQEAEVISQSFTGFPDQVRYAVSIMKQESTQYLIDNIYCLADFNKDRVLRYIGNIDKDGKDSIYWQLLKLLSLGTTFTPYLIYKVLDTETNTISKHLSRLLNSSLLEKVGDDADLIVLNDAAKDYIQRLPYGLKKEYLDNLQLYTKEVIEDSFTGILNRGHSDYVLALKEALKSGDSIPDKYLIPSHYVNAIRELYRDSNRRPLVIALADKILSSAASLDPALIDEIRYWLCLTLARDRNARFLGEVEKVRRDADRYFLKGFYFRKIGKAQLAVEQLTKALRSRTSFAQAERELAEAYCAIGDYKSAYELAEKSYKIDPTSEHHIQCYLKCMIHVHGRNKKEEIISLIDQLRECHGDKAQEMHLTSLAMYYSNIETDQQMALQYADSAISNYPMSMYSYLTKLEILCKLPERQLLESTLKEIESKFKKGNDIYLKFPYIAANITYLALTHQIRSAEEKLAQCKNNFAKHMIDNLQKRIDFYK